MNSKELHAKLTSAALKYDERASRRKGGWNPYALPQYVARIQAVVADIEAGAPVRQAICAGFHGSLLSAMLRAAGEPKATNAEIRGDGGWCYQPVKLKA